MLVRQAYRNYCYGTQRIIDAHVAIPAARRPDLVTRVGTERHPSVCCRISRLSGESIIDRWDRRLPRYLNTLLTDTIGVMDTARESGTGTQLNIGDYLRYD